MKTTREKRTYDLNIVSATPLVTPAELKEKSPLGEKGYKLVTESREVVKSIIHKNDARLLGIVGPCSIHDKDLALDYASRFAALRKEVEDEIYLIMRVYFEKPRTALGWRGLIIDPHIDGSYDIDYGLKLARELLVHIVEELGIPAGSELLDPIVPQYIDDLISWAAIGARTTESQIHREMASGLSMPVGFKNGTDGSYDVAINALESSRASHSFLGTNQKGETCILKTAGNPHAHIISRGGTRRPNYSPRDLAAAEELLESAGIDPAILIDCSHGNSGKRHSRQEAVLKEIVDRKRSGSQSIIGFMLESNIHAGNQKIPEDPKDLRYGVSITDECVDWDATERMVRGVAERLRR